MNDDQDSEHFFNQEYNEILMFSNEFSIQYDHYDAMDLNNNHQIVMRAFCKDIGLHVIQKKVERGQADSEYEESESITSDPSEIQK